MHIDLVGPLPSSQGFTYALTCIDRFSRWPEVFPICDISADTVARAFVTGWISRFGSPARITTDQGRQFESSLFTALSAVLGAQRIRTTPYHPAANGLVERFHRQLKAAIKCYNTERWVEVLPLVLLGIRTAIKEDLGVSSAELVYGTTLRLPGEYFEPGSTTPDPATFAGQLRQTMEQIRPSPTSAHSRPAIFIPKALNTASHVFVRHDAIRKPLQAPYDGPFAVLARGDRTFTLDIRGRRSTIGIDRLKPAFLLPSGPQQQPGLTPPVTPAPTVPEVPVSSDPVPVVPATTPPAPVQVIQPPAPVITRAGRRVRFNPRYFSSDD